MINLSQGGKFVCEMAKCAALNVNFWMDSLKLKEDFGLLLFIWPKNGEQAQRELAPAKINLNIKWEEK
jgi:hypothetical protein